MKVTEKRGEKKKKKNLLNTYPRHGKASSVSYRKLYHFHR